MACDDGAARIDDRAVMDRVRRERDRPVRFALRDVERIPRTDRLFSHAGLVDDPMLEVGGHRRVIARTVVINTVSIGQMLAMPCYHPVLDEGPRTALQDVGARLRGARSGPVAELAEARA